MIEIIDVHADNVEQTGFFLHAKQTEIRRLSEQAGMAESPVRRRHEDQNRPGRRSAQGLHRVYPKRVCLESRASGELYDHSLLVGGWPRQRQRVRLPAAAGVHGRRAGSRQSGRGGGDKPRDLAYRYVVFRQQRFSRGSRSSSGIRAGRQAVRRRAIARFPDRWDERAGSYGDGLTVLRSDQCPYNEQAVDTIREAAGELGIEVRVIEMTHCREAQGAPSAYGTFQVLYNGKLLTYHPMTKRELLKLLQEAK